MKMVRSISPWDLCLLLRLHKYLFIALMQDWLVFDNIVKVDSAFCNTTYRSLFKRLISNIKTMKLSQYFCHGGAVWMNNNFCSLDHRNDGSGFFPTISPSETHIITNKNWTNISNSMGNSLMRNVKRVFMERSPHAKILIRFGVNVEMLTFQDNDIFTEKSKGEILSDAEWDFNDSKWFEFTGGMTQKTMPHLTGVCFSPNEASDGLVKRISENFPDLKSVSINLCNRVTDYGVITLINNCKLMTSLNLKSVSNLSNETLTALQFCGHHLTTLKLGGLGASRSRISGSSLEQLFEVIGVHLTTVDLSYFCCFKSHPNIVVHCVSVTCLNVSASDFDNNTIDLLCCYCKKIQRLKLDVCPLSVCRNSLLKIVRSLDFMNAFSWPTNNYKFNSIVMSSFLQKLKKVKSIGSSHLSGLLHDVLPLISHDLTVPGFWSYEGTVVGITYDKFSELDTVNTMTLLHGNENFIFPQHEAFGSLFDSIFSCLHVHSLCDIQLSNVSDNSAFKIASSCHRLNFVNFRECGDLLTSAGIVAICKTNWNIQGFVLGGKSIGRYNNKTPCLLDNNALIGDGISSLIELRVFELYRAENITIVGIDDVIAKCRNLSFVQVIDCCGICEKELNNSMSKCTANYDSSFSVM